MTEVSELAALEDEVLQFILEEGETEKEEVKPSTEPIADDRGKQFHEVIVIHAHVQVFPASVTVTPADGCLVTIPFTDTPAPHIIPPQSVG